MKHFECSHTAARRRSICKCVISKAGEGTRVSSKTLRVVSTLAPGTCRTPQLARVRAADIAHCTRRCTKPQLNALTVSPTDINRRQDELHGLAHRTIFLYYPNL